MPSHFGLSVACPVQISMKFVTSRPPAAYHGHQPGEEQKIRVQRNEAVTLPVPALPEPSREAAQAPNVGNQEAEMLLPPIAPDAPHAGRIPEGLSETTPVSEPTKCHDT